MAKTKDVGGKTSAIGALDLQLNPPEAETSGVEYSETWARAEFAEGKMTVRIFGRAEYAGRSVTDHRDIEDKGLAPLKDAFKTIIAAYEPQIKEIVMDAAYAARTKAKQLGEVK
jgi:hypothetical protein